ncbi:MAG: metal ABC transporter ATP-binding protein [Planctomycetota bacterium]
MHDECAHVSHGRIEDDDGRQDAVVIRNVSFSYPGGVEALREVSLRIKQGERLGLLGPNGGGKTTLMSIAQGLLPCQRGSIEVLGRSPERARREGLIGAVLQRSATETGFPIAVRQVVEQAAGLRLSPWKRLPSGVRDQIESAMLLTAVDDLADRPFDELSGGQRQRVLISRAIAARPAILMLDEPTVGVDIAGQRRFAELLDSLQRDLGLTIVIISHELRTVATACDRIACLKRTLHVHGAPSGLTPEVLAEVFEHDITDALDARARTPGGDA